MYSNIYNILKEIKDYISENKSDAYGDCILSAIEKEDDPNGEIVISLLRIEEETSRKPQSVYEYEYVDGKPNIKKKAKPNICLNLYILIASYAKNYETALNEISDVIYLMNSFSKDEIIADLQSLTAEQHNSMWQTLGGKNVPCVVYKIRMVTISSVVNGEIKAVEEVTNNIKKETIENK